MDPIVHATRRRFAAIRWRDGRRRAIGFLAGLACACATSGWIATAVAADKESDLEHTVKAVFLYKFLNYAEWPPTAFSGVDAPFVIGIYGADEIADALTLLAAGRTVSGRFVQVRRIRRGEALSGVHMLFVGVAETAQLPSLVRAAQRTPLLVVSEADDALDLGSAINLLVVDGRVRFDVSLDAAEKSGVRLSSRLLAVARSVRNRGG